MTMRPIDVVVIDGSREVAIGTVAAADAYMRISMTEGFESIGPSRAAKRIDDVIIRLRRRSDGADLRLLTMIDDDCVHETHVAIDGQDPRWRETPDVEDLTRISDALRMCAEALTRPIAVTNARGMLRHIQAAAAVAACDPPVTRVWLPTPWLELSMETGGEEGPDGLPSAHEEAPVDPGLIREMNGALPCAIEIVADSGHQDPVVTIRPFALTRDHGIASEGNAVRWVDGQGRIVGHRTDPVVLMRWIEELHSTMNGIGTAPDGAVGAEDADGRDASDSDRKKS